PAYQELLHQPTEHLADRQALRFGGFLQRGRLPARQEQGQFRHLLVKKHRTIGGEGRAVAIGNTSVHGTGLPLTVREMRIEMSSQRPARRQCSARPPFPWQMVCRANLSVVASS